jgi:hypothetical protein
MLLIMCAVLGGGLGLLLYSGLRSPSGAATGDAAGCGGDPLAAPDAEETGYILGTAASDPDAPVKISWKGAQNEVSCPALTAEPVDQVASWEDPCAEPGTIRVWELTAQEATALVEAYQAIRDRTCTSADCLHVLTQADKTLDLELEAPMEAQIALLLKKAGSVPPTSTGETPPPEAQPPEEAQVDPPTPPPQTSSVTFGPEEGVDFAAATVVQPGHPLKTDLICYAGSQGLDCQAGAGPSISQQKHLRLFRTPGGVIQTFGGLAAVPQGVVPGAADRDMVNGATAGWGFVVENNLSDSYARVWIKKATESSITLQFQVFSAD